MGMTWGRSTTHFVRKVHPDMMSTFTGVALRVMQQEHTASAQCIAPFHPLHQQTLGAFNIERFGAFARIHACPITLYTLSPACCPHRDVYMECVQGWGFGASGKPVLIPFNFNSQVAVVSSADLSKYSRALLFRLRPSRIYLFVLYLVLVRMDARVNSALEMLPLRRGQQAW